MIGAASVCFTNKFQYDYDPRCGLRGLREPWDCGCGWLEEKLFTELVFFVSGRVFILIPIRFRLRHLIHVRPHTHTHNRSELIDCAAIMKCAWHRGKKCLPSPDLDYNVFSLWCVKTFPLREVPSHFSLVLVRRRSFALRWWGIDFPTNRRRLSDVDASSLHCGQGQIFNKIGKSCNVP